MSFFPLSKELLLWEKEIKQFAIDYGLDFHPVMFEMCNYDMVCVLAAQGGFPSRFLHWRFGMEYEQFQRGNAYGLQKIYELVVNTNPVRAYLLNSNRLIDQKLVMAHVYGHADFFKNNSWFRKTDRQITKKMEQHALCVRRSIENYGGEKVESFIDTVLSLENLLDINILFESNSLQKINNWEGSRDILLFLLKNAPLEEWEANIVELIREEAYYFLPQRLTKIINEGWASYWHSQMMTQKIADSNDIIDFANIHARVVSTNGQNFNPYKIGIELFRDIKLRWDKGQFGKEYHECNNAEEKNNWDMKLGKGNEKIFEVRKTHNDATFIDEFLTEEFCLREKLFTYKYNPRSGRVEIDSRDFLAIKQKLLISLANAGQPSISLGSKNYKNKGLYLVHDFQGVELDVAYANNTMKNLFSLWKEPVFLETIQGDQTILFSHDGREFKVAA